MIALPPKVRPGDPFTPRLFNQLLDCVRSLTPQPGANTRITRMPGAFQVNFDPPGVNWDHPFRCSLTGNKLSVSIGLVNQVEPTIGGVRISGLDAKGNAIAGGPPVITLGNEVDSEGRNWVALKVITDGSGHMTAEILTTTTWPQAATPFVGWHPLAVVKTISGTPTLWQQTYHNLGHAWLKPSVGIGRHFFWAV